MLKVQETDEEREGKEHFKADPYAYHSETRPGTASRVYDISGYNWKDNKWMENREAPYNEPVSIYEMHLGSWRRYADGNTFSYEKIAEELIPYVKEMGFNGIWLMPIHPSPTYHKYDVTGGLCENNDKFAIDRMLPKIDLDLYNDAMLKLSDKLELPFDKLKATEAKYSLSNSYSNFKSLVDDDFLRYYLIDSAVWEGAKLEE